MINLVRYFGLSLCVLLLIIPFNSSAQHRNDNWAFGDSAGVSFVNLANPITFSTVVKTRGSCASISDTNGNMLFYYAYTPHKSFTYFYDGEIYNKYGNIIGDTIVSDAWYNEGTITQYPNSPSQYYVFTIGVTGAFGLYYSIVDMSLNNGLGAVIQKNVQLLSYPANDGLIAVKHGNGRDWWVLFRRSAVLNDDYFLYLIDPQGIHAQPVQHIGALASTNIMNYAFNANGTQLAQASYGGLVELFDFDRCSGLLSNYKMIRPFNTAPPNPGFWSCEFSYNNRYLYISAGEQTIYLIQLDLQSANIWQSADTIYSDTTIIYGTGALKRGPDKKIYWSRTYYDSLLNGYPYPDTLFNIYNTHLSVINEPDSAGSKCNFTPYSFYLGGARTYLGLPNNPDYDLGRLYGSPCDTLQWTNLTPALSKGEGVMQITYISAWEKLFINASGLKGKNVTVSIYDGKGSLKFEVRGLKSNAGYFTIDVNCAGGSPSGVGGARWANGLYVVNFQTEVERLSKKFIKE